MKFPCKCISIIFLIFCTAFSNFFASPHTKLLLIYTPSSKNFENNKKTTDTIKIINSTHEKINSIVDELGLDAELKIYRKFLTVSETDCPFDEFVNLLKIYQEINTQVICFNRYIEEEHTNNILPEKYLTQILSQYKVLTRTLNKIIKNCFLDFFIEESRKTQEILKDLLPETDI